MTVYDRWHKSRPRAGDQPCREHGKSPAVGHGTGDRWQVRWRDDTGRQRKENFGKRSDADTRDAQVRASLTAGTYIDSAAGKVKFAVFAEQWRGMQVHREATGALTERAMRLYVNPVLGDLPLAAVRPFHVQQLVKQLCDELAPTTVHVTYGYVASVFKSAVRDRLIARTPCEGIRLPAIPRREMFIPEPSSVLDVADLLPRCYRAAPLTAAQSGLRPSEVFGLEVECVDFLRRTIRVRQQLVTSIEPGNIAYLGEPKTPHSDRTVPVTAATVDTLAAHLADFPAREVEVEDRPTRATRNAALPAWSSRPRVASRSSGQAGAARGCLRLARRDSRPALACTAAVTCTRRH